MVYAAFFPSPFPRKAEEEEGGKAASSTFHDTPFLRASPTARELERPANEGAIHVEEEAVVPASRRGGGKEEEEEG